MSRSIPDKLIEAVPPQERLALKKQINNEYNSALNLLKKKAYKEALRKFKWIFAQNAASDLFLSERDIRKLINNHPPARSIVKRWRDNKEDLLLAGKYDLALLNQWRELNSSLGDRKRALELFLKLKASSADERLLHYILSEIWEELARARKYELLATLLKQLGSDLLLDATEYDCMLLFPTCHSKSRTVQKQMLQMHLDAIMTDGILSYEVAVGLGNKFIASEFAKKILFVESSDRAFAGLIRSAIRARGYDEALSLYEEARTKFSLRRLPKSSAAIKRLPTSFHSKI